MRHRASTDERPVVIPIAGRRAHRPSVAGTEKNHDENEEIRTSMVELGMHLNAVGGDCPGKTELDAAILLRPDARIVVEYEPQTRIEGELQQVDATTPVIGFDRVVRGDAAGRASPRDVTIFDSVVSRSRTSRRCATCTTSSTHGPSSGARST